MIESLELREAQTHPLMPASYVEFVRQLWRTQTNESQYTFSRGLVTARQLVFSRLLASERLGTELCRVYETPVGSQIAEALTCQAVHILELWKGEDRRAKEEKVAQVEKLRSAIKNVVALLGNDRSAPEAANDLPRLIFENVFSKPVRVGRRNVPPIKATLSLYEIHEALQAFDKPLRQMIENINKFRTHAVDDPLLMHVGQVTKGTAYIRHAALLLDQSIDRFTGDFTKFKRKLSRDKLVSAFVKALHEPSGAIADYQAINRIVVRVENRSPILSFNICRTDGRRDPFARLTRPLRNGLN